MSETDTGQFFTSHLTHQMLNLLGPTQPNLLCIEVISIQPNRRPYIGRPISDAAMSTGYDTTHGKLYYITCVIIQFLYSTTTSISCRWRTRATRCITANVLQTKVDAQCDNLWPNEVDNACDGRRFRVTAVICRKSSILTAFDASAGGDRVWVLPRSSAPEN